MSHHLVGVAEIAELLGVSRQRVNQIVSDYEDFPQPEAELSAGRIWSRAAVETWIALHPERGPGVGTEERAGFFRRFSEDARRVILAAHEEAVAAGGSTVEPVHLLAGLLSPAAGDAARGTLGDLGLTLDAVRKRIGGDGRGSGEAPGPISFSDVARAVLEHAFRTAHRSRRSVDSDAVLYGLLVTPGAADLLASLGIPARTRSELVRRLAGRTATLASVEPSTGGAMTISLTKREQEVMELVAQGLDNRAVTGRLGVTENTVRQHLRNISEKLTFRLVERESRTGTRQRLTDPEAQEAAETPGSSDPVAGGATESAREPGIEKVLEALDGMSARLDEIERRLAG